MPHQDPHIAMIMADPATSAKSLQIRDAVRERIESDAIQLKMTTEKIDALMEQNKLLLQRVTELEKAKEPSKKRKTHKQQQQPEKPEDTAMDVIPTTSSNQDNEPENSNTASEVKKMPPIIVKDANEWPAINQKSRNNQIKIKKAKMTGEGVAITPETSTDFRNLTKLLKEDKKEFFTYTLDEDKTFRAVIRGIPTNMPEEAITNDLNEQGIKTLSVQRMKRRIDKKAMPLVLVQVKPEDKDNLLALRDCCSLIIRIEPQRKHQGPSQCHRCQQFGHSQKFCNAQARCVKCGANHHSGDCKKNKNLPAKCANCGGPHPASYRGCTKFPTLTKKPTDKTAKPPITPAPVIPGRTFANAASKNAVATATSPANQTTAPPMDFQSVVAQMKNMLDMMSSFMSSMTPMPSTTNNA